MDDGIAALQRKLPADRSIVLVGMMGAGKSSVGKRLAARIGRRFVDADSEIETAAGLTIPEIFELHGEAAFRDGERRVIARLLSEGPLILATGGGAFCDPDTRAAIGERGISVYLAADLDVLFRRVSRRSDRPLLQTPDPRGTLKALLAARAPIYRLADITVESRDEPHESAVAGVIEGLVAYLDGTAQRSTTAP